MDDWKNCAKNNGIPFWPEMTGGWLMPIFQVRLEIKDIDGGQEKSLA